MKFTKRIFAIIIAAVFLAAAGCSQTAAERLDPTSASPESPQTPTHASGSLTVSAAASLTEAFTEIGKAFEAANPGVTVIFNFAGSQELAQQIVQGAPVDVFASANAKQMTVVTDDKKIPADAPQTFAANRLVVVFPADNPGGLNSLADLAKPGLKLVLAAPEVPVGQYSLNFLDAADKSGQYQAGFKAAVTANIVSYENNVRAVLSKVTLGEADGGIVYATDVGSARDQVGILPIPDTLNVIATYPIVALPDGPQPALAQAFVDFVLSSQGQQVLSTFGFSTVK